MTCVTVKKEYITSATKLIGPFFFTLVFFGYFLLFRIQKVELFLKCDNFRHKIWGLFITNSVAKLINIFVIFCDMAANTIDM